MSFILISNRGDDVQINAWNWRPTLLLLRDAELINAEQYERMGAQGVSGQVDSETAERIAKFLEKKLEEMKPGQRIRSDLTVTADSKKPVVFAPGTEAEDIDAIDLYSATYDWLVTFMKFCRRCGGFRVS